MRVADLHCDLLWYLANHEHRTVFDPESQVSVPFLQEGCVALQVFPIYTVTGPRSVEEGIRQLKIYSQLPQMAPGFFEQHLTPRVAIENASSFCSEYEPIEQALKRLESWHEQHRIVYISLTWNEENRFGGGSDTKIGLKEDGKKLLEWLSGKGIAIDLSHASDPLAQEVLQEIHSLHILPIASHSNFRSICAHRRNLQDLVAQAIAKKGGVIGLNLVRHFLGPNGPQDVLAHIRYAQKLAIENHLCLGADFFPEIDVEEEKAYLKPYFFEGFSTSACYPRLRQLLLSTFPEAFVDQIMYQHLITFLESL